MYDWYSRLFLLFGLFVSSSYSNTCGVIDQCSCKLYDTKQVISLWGIDDPNDIVFLKVDVGNNQFLRYNPCTPFDEDGGSCHEDLVCLHTTGTGVEKTYSSGSPSRFNTDVNGTNIIFKYIGQEQDGQARETEVKLVCNRDKLVPEIKDPKMLPQSTTKYSFELHTHCACPGLCVVKPPGTGNNMSVGSILLTIFFVMFGAYFIFGHLFLKYHRHLEGESSIPNYEFWKELPTNVKAGFAFIKEMLCGREEGYEGI